MRKKYPVLVVIPHASTFVPIDLRRMMTLTDREIEQASDLYTDEIFDLSNAHIVKAKLSRLVADVNRAPDDIEIKYQLYHDGVVVHVDEFGKPIYKEPPPMEEIFERVTKYHEPFHQEIEKLAPKMKFLIDAHSLLSTGPSTRHDAGEKRADIVLGNRDYTTCSRDMTIKIMHFFEERGFSVAVNDPYSGKYILGYHCSRRKLPGIQVEVNRKLYMNQKTLARKEEGIKRLRAVMRDLVDMIGEKLF